MGSQRLIQEYPPKSWICPTCGKEHSKAHYSLPGQLDYTKKPNAEGRILFNRRKSRDNSLSDDTPIDKAQPSKGEQLDEEGIQRPLYCPHCGYEDEIEVVVRMGELPGLLDTFFQEEGVDPKKTWVKLLNQFMTWLKKRGDGQ